MAPGSASNSESRRGTDRHWHTLASDEVVEFLEGDPQQGLSEGEAKRRREVYGPNEVASAEATPWWRVLIKQFVDPLIYILFAAAVAALAFEEYIDAGVIVAVLVINGAIGFFQEMRARKAILSLAEMTAPKARVIRNGQEREIPSEEVVPGDVIALRAGANVPADLRLLHARELSVDESALTGESVPVSKQTQALQDRDLVPGDQLNMAFSTTVVTRGRGRGIVVGTGEHTELGQIASSMRDVVETQAPIQRKVRSLSHWIGAAIVGLTIVVGLVGWLQQRPLDEIASMAIAMAVAAIPEALPIVLTVTLAVGVQRMAKRNAITRSLPAVETLGSTTVIGSDKTGTLTKNEMTVKAIWTGDVNYEIGGSGYARDGTIRRDGNDVELDEESLLRDCLLTGLLANEAPEVPAPDEAPQGDPTELALLVAAEKAGLSVESTREEYHQLDEIPFESQRQFMASLRQEPHGGARLYLKGAPEAILERCTRELTESEPTAIDRQRAQSKAKELASRGYRVLAMAYAPWDREEIDEEDIGDQLIFAGLQAMEDPLRPEAIAAVEQTREAGIRVLMLTGDHRETAQAIGRQIGLGDGETPQVLEGRQLQQLDDDEIDRILGEIDVYARVAPEHKLQIVEHLQSRGEVVAVTGDGVNDAPALRAADLGVAMGKEGTDVAREASDMVLSDDNFASITAAVEEGRVVFNNIRKVTYFLLSTGVGLVLTIMLALFFGWPLPFVAVQVLWINLVTKGLQDISLAFEPGEPGQLDLPPRPPNEGIFHRPVLIRMFTIGAFLGVVTLAVFWWFYQATGDLVLSQSIAMTQMVIFQFFHVANCRSLHRSIFSIPPFSNPALFFAVLAALLAHITILYVPALQFLFQTTPLSLNHWAIVFGIALSIIVVVEIDKLWLRRRGFGPGLARPSHPTSSRSQNSRSNAGREGESQPRSAG